MKLAALVQKSFITGGILLALTCNLPARADFGDEADGGADTSGAGQSASDAGLDSNMDTAGPEPGAMGPAQDAPKREYGAATGSVNSSRAEFRRQAQEMQNEQAALYMQQQMQQVASYVADWCTRNSRFPEQSGEWQQKWDVERQLDMLVPNNPYALGTTMQAEGTQQVSQYNANGSPSTGAPAAYPFENQETQMYAESNQRCKLYSDNSLTPDMIDYYTAHPPEDWTAAPGSIICVGSNHGYLMVWGAGADGKPLKNVLNGQMLIVSSSWGLNEQDMHSPNEDE